MNIEKELKESMDAFLEQKAKEMAPDAIEKARLRSMGIVGKDECLDADPADDWDRFS